MTDATHPPPRRDPLVAPQMGHVQQGLRSRATRAMAARAAQGRFVLQVCSACGSVTYPPRDRCPLCWGTLHWQDQPIGATVLSQTNIRTSPDTYFRDHLPWRIGTVHLDAGPSVIAHLHGEVQPGKRVRMALLLDRGGNPALFALPDNEVPNMQDDPQLRQFTASPKHRRVLVTDGRTKMGQSVAAALISAGADTVFLGNAAPQMRYDGQDEVEVQHGIETVALDVTDTRSVERLAAQLGGRVEIIVNTAGHTRSGGVSNGGTLTDMQTAMDIGVSGVMRLARAFGPALSARSGDGVRSAVAFVDICSAYGLTGNPDFSGHAAVSAARLSLVTGFRAEMQHAGIRVMSVLTGPEEDDWHQDVPPPKVTAEQVARAVVSALEEGRELTTVGPVAKDVFERWQADPLLAIREENQ